MNKFQQLWIMPPLYHRVFDFLTRTTVQTRQEYSYQALARFVGWYNNEDWEEPSESQIGKILNWLHNNDFIILENGETHCKITVIWQHAHNIKPMSEAEYNVAYSSIFTETYKELSGVERISKDDVQAIFELSANHVSIKKATDVMKGLLEKNDRTPTVGYIKDYVFADICYGIACGR